jgi:hypothetical protein
MPYHVIDVSESLYDGRRDVRDLKDIKGIAIHRINVGSNARDIRDFFVEGEGGRYTGNQMPYTFVVSPFGVIEQALDLREVGPHARRWSVPMISIACIGDFRHHPPDTDQFYATKELCIDLCLYINKAEIKGHDELPGGSSDPNKQCPGKMFGLSMLRIQAFLEIERIKRTNRVNSLCAEYHLSRCGVRV